MVDVGAKRTSRRRALASARVVFPAHVASTLRAGEWKSAKGSVLDTAIIAGTMAVKKTHELIPFCHPLAIDGCRFEMEFETDNELVIRCEVSIEHRTGVEMEALTGAGVAALTVYDMCKALSHEIVISELRLIDKQGGKRNVRGGKAR